jgi:hypothetical protein
VATDVPSTESWYRPHHTRLCGTPPRPRGTLYYGMGFSAVITGACSVSVVSLRQHEHIGEHSLSFAN